jgi:hypothetical protein
MTDTSLIAGSRTVVMLARGILWAFFGIAIVVGLYCLISGALSIGQHLSSGYTQLTLVANKPLPKQLHPAALYGTTRGSYPTATVQARGLSDTVVFLVTSAAVATILIQVALSGLVALLSWRLLRGGLFRPSIARAVSGAGLVLTIGGLISQAGVALAGGAAASELNGGGRGFWPLAGSFDPTLLIFGIVLLIVGLAFEYGVRLQKESEGLV